MPEELEKDFEVCDIRSTTLTTWEVYDLTYELFRPMLTFVGYYAIGAASLGFEYMYILRLRDLGFKVTSGF